MLNTGNNPLWDQALEMLMKQSVQLCKTGLKDEGRITDSKLFNQLRSDMVAIVLVCVSNAYPFTLLYNYEHTTNTEYGNIAPTLVSSMSGNTSLNLVLLNLNYQVTHLLHSPACCSH